MSPPCYQGQAAISKRAALIEEYTTLFTTWQPGSAGRLGMLTPSFPLSSPSTRLFSPESCPSIELPSTASSLQSPLLPSFLSRHLPHLSLKLRHLPALHSCLSARGKYPPGLNRRLQSPTLPSFSCCLTLLFLVVGVPPILPSRCFFNRSSSPPSSRPPSLAICCLFTHCEELTEFHRRLQSRLPFIPLSSTPSSRFPASPSAPSLSLQPCRPSRQVHPESRKPFSRTLLPRS
jgi:hypothetical protein